MRKRIIIISLVLVLALFTLIGSLWISSYNKAVVASHDIKEHHTKIFVKYNARYEKVLMFINAIESANEQINTQITAITDARARFAAALDSNNYEDAEAETEIIESTFITLVSYMEDNKESWNTVGLTRDFMFEFAADTNAVGEAIIRYNTKIADYNKLISLFPNRIFLKGFAPNEDYEVPTLVESLPTFS